MIYPGGNIIFKRLTYTVVLCTISVNLFIAKVQNRVQVVSLELVRQVEGLGPSYHNTTESIRNLLPMLEGLEKKGIPYLMDKNKMPLSKRISESLNQTDRVFDQSKDLQPILKVCSAFLKVTSITLWLGVLWAGVWMYFDFRKGRYPSITLLLIFFAVWVNLRSPIWIQEFICNGNF